jgi:hypothetical protein
VGTALPAGPDIFKVVLERLHQAESLGGNRVCASEA